MQYIGALSHPMESGFDHTGEPNNTVTQFYDQIAATYDSDRFGNSYGEYIDRQERAVLGRWLVPTPDAAILDFGCGTGRLSSFATHGLDPSRAMVEIASSKHPQNDIRCGDVGSLARFGITFDAIFCLHVLMHLPAAEISNIISRCLHCLQPRGKLIFDLPSSTRRRFTGFHPSNWHAATSMDRQDVLQIVNGCASLHDARGILFFPVHRIPEQLRPVLRFADSAIGATPIKNFCSYILYCFERK